MAFIIAISSGNPGPTAEAIADSWATAAYPNGTKVESGRGHGTSLAIGTGTVSLPESIRSACVTYAYASAPDAVYDDCAMAMMSTAAARTMVSCAGVAALAASAA